MAAGASERLSAAKTGWVVVALLAAWVAFLLFPSSPEKPPAQAKMPVALPGEAELAAVGLRYNADWVGLPEYFAVWAKDLNWDEGRVAFSYWNPGSESYSYFFEATKRGSGYRFRPVSPDDLTARNGFYVYADDEHGGEIISLEVDVLRAPSAAHPFIFWAVDRKGIPTGESGKALLKKEKRELTAVKIDLPVKRLTVPQTLDTKPSLDESGK